MLHSNPSPPSPVRAPSASAPDTCGGGVSVTLAVLASVLFTTAAVGVAHGHRALTALDLGCGLQLLALALVPQALRSRPRLRELHREEPVSSCTALALFALGALCVLAAPILGR